MIWLVLRAYWSLLRFESCLQSKDFRALHRQVRGGAPARTRPHDTAVARTCRAVEEACLWYPKPVLCLQRSAALAWLLKREGVAAEMVIGVRQAPFAAHAWVEVAGRVVNDQPDCRERYAVIERC